MGGIYGISKAAKANEAGDYDAAVVEATRAIALDAEDPEPWSERAFAQAHLSRYDEAVADLERAIDLDATAGVLDTDATDDLFFSSLLGAARADAKGSVEVGARRLLRYAERLPEGKHLKEARDWALRVRGDLKQTEYIKQRD
ncbi:MAG: hypothetical protein EXR72_05995 [Myxococcales bacterium]|nr:hypothetical protein [Myxococcales bacterium]